MLSLCFEAALLYNGHMNECILFLDYSTLFKGIYSL